MLCLCYGFLIIIIFYFFYIFLFTFLDYCWNNYIVILSVWNLKKKIKLLRIYVLKKWSHCDRRENLKTWRPGITRQRASVQHNMGERQGSFMFCNNQCCCFVWEIWHCLLEALKPSLHLFSHYASWCHAVLHLSWAFQHQNPIISTPNPHSVSNSCSLQKANGSSCSDLSYPLTTPLFIMNPLQGVMH